MTESPYLNIPTSEWHLITAELVDSHPISRDELVSVVLGSWEYIIGTKFGEKYTIGVDLKLKPQIMGFFLHELIALEISNRYPAQWRTEVAVADKDVVCITDEIFSIEIKTSSSKKHIYGNRSFAQVNKDNSAKKSKSGYYLAINFEKFSNHKIPEIIMIRFGWLDHEDWMGQAASTGQQSRLSNETEDGKLEIIYLKQ